jgi:ribosomal protein S12 methylthiotransferase
MKTFIVSLGCPKNTVDAEAFMGILDRDGCTIVSDPREADLLIVNACSFIDSAWRETVEEVERLSGLKIQDPGKRLVVMGCLPLHRPNGWREALAHVDRFLPAGSHSLLPSLVDAFREDARPPRRGHGDDGGVDRFAGFEDRIRTTPLHTAYVKIAEGCDRTCAFCAIPKIRGPMTSRRMGSILREVGRLVEQGVREVTLLAQDITSYRDGRARFTDLVESIARSGVEWIRVFYVHPGSLTMDFARSLFGHPSVCRYLEVPVQHASDRVLERMGRFYTRARLERTFGEIRAEFPDVVIRSEVIVGFPGEGEDEFEELKSFVETAQFASLGIFEFSSEPGTAADSFDQRVGAGVVKERAAQIADVQNSVTFGLLSSEKGRRHRILVDRRVENGGGEPRGFSHAGRYYGQAYDIDGEVYLEGPSLEVGEFVTATIVDADAFDLQAKADPPRSP